MLDELVTVASEDESHIEAFGVDLGLFEAVVRRLVLRFGLNQRYGDGLRVSRDLDAQGVVDTSLGLLEGPAVDDLDGAGSLFATDEVLGPSSSMDGGID